MKHLDQIPGGRAAFEAAYAEVALLAAVKQRRFGAHLASLGPPGQAAWDPLQGYVTLRGTHFGAQQIGSFDGRSWMWSWANHHLQLPDPLTSFARTLRDSVPVAAFTEPMIAAADERIPYMMAGFALAHTPGSGYYIANRSQVYVVDPIDALQHTTDLEELEAAMAVLRAEPTMPFDAARGIRFATDRIAADDLHREEGGGRLTVRVGEDELVVDAEDARLQRLAVAFLPGRTTLADVIRSIAEVEGVPALRVRDDGAFAEGPGWRARLRVDDSLKAVVREAKALPGRGEEARTKATVAILETEHDPDFRDGLAPSGAMWMPAAMVVDPVGVVASPALRIAEALNGLSGALVYDFSLRTFYP